MVFKPATSCVRDGDFLFSFLILIQLNIPKYHSYSTDTRNSIEFNSPRILLHCHLRTNTCPDYLNLQNSKSKHLLSRKETKTIRLLQNINVFNKVERK